MSKFFHLSKKQPKLSCRYPRKKISVKLLNLFILSLVVVTGMSYLIQANSIATKGYAIKDLQTKIDQLKQDGNNLQLQISELQSMDNIKNRISQLDMVSAGQAEYLAPTPVALAAR